jgi:hypothetical protein
MSGSNEGSGKGPAKPTSDTAAGKKPSAIIDLKATEVKPTATKPSSEPTGTAGAKEAPADTKAAGTPPGAGSKPGDAKPTPAAAQPSSTPPKSAVPPAPAAKASRPGIGIGSIATHMFAGIAGGFLVLLGADSIAPQLGLGGPGASTAEMQRRMAAIEAAAKAKPPAPSPELAQKLVAAEARLAKVEELGRALPALTEEQAKLAAEAKALAEQVGKPAPGADAEKLARLEAVLATLTTAANSEQAGRIPQLAQISGKLADLEASLAAQMAAARKSITQDVESRLGQATEAAEQARSGVQRMDRELGTIKTEAARNGQRIEGIDQSLRAARDEAAGLKSTVDGLKSEVASQLKTVARPQDVSSALAPISSKLAAVEQNLAGVVKSEDDRKANAERIVLSLELANLKRALDRGGQFAAELAAVQKIGGGKLDLKALEAAKDKGVATTTALANDFRSVAYAVIAADSEPADSSVVDKLISGAKSIVRVRKSNAEAGDNSAEAIAARIDASLKAGRLDEVTAEAKKLSPKAQAAGSAWLAKVEARAAVDRAVAAVEGQLKTALGSKPTP